MAFFQKTAHKILAKELRKNKAVVRAIIDNVAITSNIDGVELQQLLVVVANSLEMLEKYFSEN